MQTQVYKNYKTNPMFIQLFYCYFNYSMLNRMKLYEEKKISFFFDERWKMFFYVYANRWI